MIHRTPSAQGHLEGVFDVRQLGERRASDEVLECRAVAAVPVHDAIAMLEGPVELTRREPGAAHRQLE